MPQTFYAAGSNYSAHVLDVARKAGKEPDPPPFADIGYRANNALIAHDEPIIIPKDATEKVQYEGELVAVIGNKSQELVRGRGAGLRAGLFRSATTQTPNPKPLQKNKGY